MLNNKTIFSLVLMVMQGSVRCIMLDWMMPYSLASNQDSFANVLDQGFRNGMFTLQKSMNNLKSNIQNMKSDIKKMNSEFKNIRNRTYTINDLAAVIYLNDNDTSSYYSTGGCNCINLACLCCAHLEIDELNLNETACLSLTYLSSNEGLNLKFSVNNLTYFNQTNNVSNPNPLCVNVPEFKDAASLCLNFYDMVIRYSSLSGCLDVIAKLGGTEVARLKVGCFESELNSKFFQQNIITSSTFGNVIRFNQFNSDSNLNPNLVLQKVSIINDSLFTTSNSVLKKGDYFFINSNRFNALNNFKRDIVVEEFPKRHKRD